MLPDAARNRNSHATHQIDRSQRVPLWVALERSVIVSGITHRAEQNRIAAIAQLPHIVGQWRSSGLQRSRTNQPFNALDIASHMVEHVDCVRDSLRPMPSPGSTAIMVLQALTARGALQARSSGRIFQGARRSAHFHRRHP